jgi:hypothetical protein
VKCESELLKDSWHLTKLLPCELQEPQERSQTGEEEHKDLGGYFTKTRKGQSWYNKERCKFEELGKSGCLWSTMMSLKEPESQEWWLMPVLPGTQEYYD